MNIRPPFRSKARPMPSIKWVRITFLLARHAALGQEPPIYFLSRIAVRLLGHRPRHQSARRTAAEHNDVVFRRVHVICLLRWQSEAVTAENLAVGWVPESETRGE